MKTIFEKNGHRVVVSTCYKVINGEIKTHHIRETNQYFSSEKRAIRAANDLLLKKAMCKFRYAERQKEKRKRNGANRIAKLYACYKETEEFIKRWDGELYLETKKNLVKELCGKLEVLCTKHEFDNPREAINFLDRR